MGVSQRKMLAIGLSLAGVIYLAAPTRGQQPRADRTVQTTAAATATASTGTLKPAVPTIIGTMDVEQVFKSYDKTKAVMKELQGAIKVRQGELMKYDDQIRSAFEMMKKLNPSSEDYRKEENRLTELKAKMEATKEQAEREITLRNAETMATLYKEIQMYAKWVAQKRGITHVIYSSSAPPTGNDPNSVMAAISRPVVYADPTNDITNDVIAYLNRSYQSMIGKSAGTTPKAAAQPAAGKAATGDQ